jgi:hypothetical protein
LFLTLNGLLTEDHHITENWPLWSMNVIADSSTTTKKVGDFMLQSRRADVEQKPLGRNEFLSSE